MSMHTIREAQKPHEVSIQMEAACLKGLVTVCSSVDLHRHIKDLLPFSHLKKQKQKKLLEMKKKI